MESEALSNGWQLGLNIYQMLAPILTAIIGWLGFKLNAYLTAHTKNELAKGIFVRLNDSVLTSVKKVNQTLLDELKKAKADTSEGGSKITEEEAIKLRDAVWLEIRSEYGGMKGLSKALKVLGLGDKDTVKAFIDNKIEAAVYDTKLVKSVATNP